MPFIGLSKPAEQTLKPMPSVGDKVPASLWLKKGSINIVAFLRHTGCPFAEQMIKHLADLAVSYPNINVVAVSHGNKKVTLDWLKGFGLTSNLQTIFDEPRIQYGEWGVGYGTFKQFLNPMMTVNLIRLWGRGIRNREASGTRWQQQAVFLVDPEGGLMYRHIATHAGDVPMLTKRLLQLTL